MAYKIVGEKYCAYRDAEVLEIICDTDADFASLPAAPTGSMAVSIASGKLRCVNTAGEWVAFGEG